jgi:lysophospholipase L1-like esterase
VEHTLEKDPGVFRILGLGDSFTYGAGAEFKEIYLSRLEDLLNRRAGEHPRVEIIKAGIPRFFPATQRILLEEYGSRFAPDLILVGFLVNDVIDTAKGLDAVVVDRSGFLKSREAAELGDLGVSLYTHSDFMRLLLSTYVNFRIQMRYPTDRGEVKKADGLHEKDWRKVEEEYARMVAAAAEWGGRVVLVHIPQKGPWDPDDDYPPARLAAWAAENEAFMVDVLPAMKDAGGEAALYYPRDGHCTPAGHEIIARTLLADLTRHGLVP